MLKKSASGVLASLGGSTYHRVRAAKSSSGRVGEQRIRRAVKTWRAYRLAPVRNRVTLTIPRVADLAVASLHNLCEHPDGILNILRNLPQINSHLNGYSS